MNKRIKELYAKASKDLDVTSEILEKFAELIIRECAKFSNEHLSNELLDYPGNFILEHFGVK